MPSDEDLPGDQWTAKLTRYILYILSLFTTLGIIFAWPPVDGDLDIAMGWFLLGVGVSILYVVYKIALEVHQLRETL